MKKFPIRPYNKVGVKRGPYRKKVKLLSLAPNSYYGAPDDPCRLYPKPKPTWDEEGE